MVSLVDIRKRVSNMIQTSTAARAAIISEVVNTGVMLMSDFQYMINNNHAIDNVKPHILYQMYDALYKNKLVSVPTTEAFPSSFRLDANIDKTKSSLQYPITIPVVQKMSDKEEYLLCLPISFVLQMRDAGLLQVRSDMQRESVMSVYDGKIVSHVKYNDKAAREIGDKIAGNEYWTNMCRWHLIFDQHASFSYDEEEKKITINSGVIAIIDGQHRSVGIEYALAKNPTAKMFLPIMLTIGDPRTAQTIIAQEETRQPISKTHVMQYENSFASNVANYLFLNSTVNALYKFVETEQQEKMGLGYIIKNDFIKSIYKEYKDVTKTKVDWIKLQRWLEEFLIELAICLNNDISRYPNNRFERWSVKSEAVPVFIHMSRVLYERPDWKKMLLEILSNIDFDCKQELSIRSMAKNAMEEINRCITNH